MVLQKNRLAAAGFPDIGAAVLRILQFIYGGVPAQVSHLIPYSVTAFRIILF